jgi:hypothetical protein
MHQEEHMTHDEAVALFQQKCRDTRQMWAYWNDQLKEYEIHYFGSNDIIGYVKPSNHTVRRV